MVLVAVNFGLWDGLAPLLGLLVGHYVGDAIGPIADYLGPLALLGFGAYLLVQAWRVPAPTEGDDEEFEKSWTLFGLPLPLSIDNIVAGTGLGLLEHPLRDRHRHRTDHRSRGALPPRRRRRLSTSQ
jgi:manganese efflux pump family protein